MTSLHFMNNCIVVPGNFSCAIDCFLEIWLRTIDNAFPDSSQYSRSYIIRILRSITGQFRTVRSSIELPYLRSDVWDYVKINCPSFLPMDCNAQFSEIFCKNVFTQLMSQQEQSKIISTYSQTAFCSSCQKSLSSQCEVVVHEPISPLFYKTKTLNIYDQVTLNNCLFVFDQLNGNIPESFTDYFMKTQQIHNHNTVLEVLKEYIYIYSSNKNNTIWHQLDYIPIYNCME